MTVGLDVRQRRDRQIRGERKKKGNLGQEDLVNENSKSPPINSPPIVLLTENLVVSQRKRGMNIRIIIIIKKLGTKKATSGAINSGVPQKVFVVLPNPMFSLHRP